MLLPNRHESSNEYRYGFQGQEKDDEIAGEGNSYTAQFWQYDSRLGRRWNVDPVVKTHESPYAAFANSPIWIIDPSGADSTLYLFVSTANEGLSESSGNAEFIGQDALGIFTANGVEWLSKIKVIYDQAEFEGIRDNLDATDGIVEYTDDGGKATTSTRGFGVTPDFFNSYIYIGSTAPVTKDNIKVLGYTTAHEFLHQVVSRIGFMAYGNVLFYQGDLGHWYGGLLTEGNDLPEYYNGVIKRPEKAGEGIEKIANEMILDIRAYTLIVSPYSPILHHSSSHTLSSDVFLRFLIIMKNEVDFNKPSQIKFGSELNNGSSSIRGDKEHYFGPVINSKQGVYKKTTNSILK